MKTYGWKNGACIRLDAQTAGERLDELKARHGHLTPELVLADAADPTSPLHGHFEWDNDRAANQHRINQAYELLRAIVVLDVTEVHEPIRAFVAIINPDTASETRRREYRTTEDVLADPILRRQFLDGVIREGEAWMDRARLFTELASVVEVADRTFASLKEDPPKKKARARKERRKSGRDDEKRPGKPKPRARPDKRGGASASATA